MLDTAHSERKQAKGKTSHRKHANVYNLMVARSIGHHVPRNDAVAADGAGDDDNSNNDDDSAYVPESDSDDEEADLDTIAGSARAAVGDAQAAASSASAAADAARRLLIEAQNGDVDADGIGRLTDATNVAFAAATAAARAASRAADADAADAETADAAAFDAANAAAQALQALDAARVVLGMCTPGPSNDVRAADLAARFLVHDPRRVAFIKSYGRNITDFAKAQFGERRSQWRTWLLRGALIVKNALFEAIGLPRAVRNMLRDALTHVERHIDAHKDMVKLLRGDTTHVVAGKVIVPAAYAKFTSWKAMAKADPSALVCLNTVRELLERVLAFPHAVNAAERALLLELLSEKKSGLIDDSKYNKLSQSTLAMTVYDMQRVLAADVTFLGAVSEESLSSARPDRPIVSRLVPSAQSAEEPTMLVSSTAMNSLRPHSQSPMAPLHLAALATGLPLETIGKHATGTIRIASDRVIVLYSAVKRDNDPDRIAAHEAHEEKVKEHYAETVNSASEWTEFMWVQLGTSAFNRARPERAKSKLLGSSAVVSMADLVARLAGGANDNGALLKLNLTRERGARRDELSAAARTKIDSPIKVARLLREQRGCDSYDVGFADLGAGGDFWRLVRAWSRRDLNETVVELNLTKQFKRAVRDPDTFHNDKAHDPIHLSRLDYSVPVRFAHSIDQRRV